MRPRFLETILKESNLASRYFPFALKGFEFSILDFAKVFLSRSFVSNRRSDDLR